jgi:hypothetical protein
MTDLGLSLFDRGELDQRAAVGFVFGRPTAPIAVPHDLLKRSLDPFG